MDVYPKIIEIYYRISVSFLFFIIFIILTLSFKIMEEIKYICVYTHILGVYARIVNIYLIYTHIVNIYIIYIHTFQKDKCFIKNSK